MKKIIAVFLSGLCVFLSGCNGNLVQKNPGYTGTTQSLKQEFGVQLEKRPLRMLNLDGELYFDSGLISQTGARCGTLDRILEKTVEPGEIPRKSGTANFSCEGCQLVTKITCEVPLDGQWLVFKKFENQAGETKNLEKFPYCFYIKGRLNNAAIDSELVVLTDDKEVTFSDVFAPLLSSQYLPDAPKKAISYDFVQSGDKWGITCTPKKLTNQGMTLQIEQFGGEYQGELQTGEWFSLSVMKEEKWIPLEPNPLIDYAFPMTAYLIQENDITEFTVEWKWLYGELMPGYYRLDKKIMDFKKAGEFTEDIYSVYFTIE
ncbi:MAG: hypothetical protein J6K51_00045 [Clostridia bacterium]|nr:hypothetical protein [Clostridia bacterium]